MGAVIREGIRSAGLIARGDLLWSDLARVRAAPRTEQGFRRLTSKPIAVSPPVGPLADLVARCGAGDRAAFRALYDRQSARLYGIALRITRDPSLAADAVHDAFIQVWERAAAYDTARGSGEAWLTALVRYRAIDLIRRRRETAPSVAAEIEDDAPGPLEALLASDRGLALHRCIGELDGAQRRAILLAFVDGLSHSEVAARIAAPLGTVKSWVRRGLLALKNCLGG